MNETTTTKQFLEESMQLKHLFQDWQRERKQMTNIKNEKRDVNATLEDAKDKKQMNTTSNLNK